jgi:hypothetical protein
VFPSLSPRRRARAHEKPAGMLPAPGPYPVARPSWQSIVIFVIITVTVIWLLDQGYSISVALEIVAGAGALAATVVPCLAGSLPAVR